MYILSEKEFEDILVLHAELIETGLTLIDRQAQLETKRTDLTFSDKDGNILLVELKKDIVSLENIFQIKDYVNRLKGKVNKQIRAMLIGQEVPIDIQEVCIKELIEWKEIKTEQIFDYLQNNDKELYESIFIEGKLHKEAKMVPMLSFQNYLNETSSPFGGPYTSYQFFKPIDASPELSDDNEANQAVADAFNNLIMDLSFDRYIFNQHIRLRREKNKSPEWSVKAKGAWQGYIIKYLLTSSDYSDGIPCEVYLGTIGYRGNKTTFADEKSRFIVVRVGEGNRQVTTQYGLHKYLRTDKKALFPFYELKFNAVGLPKALWEGIYSTLNNYGYYVKDSADKKPSKILWVGDINLSDNNATEQVANLIEALFAATIVKAHFKGNKKGIEFDFLKDYLN